MTIMDMNYSYAPSVCACRIGFISNCYLKKVISSRITHVRIAAQKYHIGIYPGAEAMEHFKPRLAKYITTKGAIRFPYKGFGSEQLHLITEIAAWCGKEENNMALNVKVIQAHLEEGWVEL